MDNPDPNDVVIEDDTVDVFYCLTVLPERDTSGFRYLGEMTHELAQRMMGPEDFLLVTQAGLDKVRAIIDDPQEADKLLVFEVEREQEVARPTGSWGVITIDIPNMKDFPTPQSWQEFLKSKARYKDHFILSGYDMATAKELFQVLPASLGSVKH